MDNTNYSMIPFRYYENSAPEYGSLVMAEILSISDTHAVCSLLEYENLKAYLYSKEFSKKRIRSINRVLKVGQKHVLQVVSNSEKDINLSKRYVNSADIISCQDQYAKGRLVHTILSEISNKLNLDIEYLYKEYIWCLNTPPHEWLETLANDDCLTLDDPILKAFKDASLKRLKRIEQKWEAKVDLQCFTEEGIDAIKRALNTGKEIDKVNISVESSPIYLLSTIGNDGENRLIESMELIKTSITESGGSYCVELYPKLV